MKPGIRINRRSGAPAKTQSLARTVELPVEAEDLSTPEPPPVTGYAPVPQEQWDAAVERVLTEDAELLRRLA